MHYLGETNYRHDEIIKNFSLIWKDNNSVQMLSNQLEILLFRSVRKRSRTEKNKY